MFNIKCSTTINKGRGVFATSSFQAGDIIEICPVIIMTPEETKNYDNTILGEFLYEWKNEQDGGVILGIDSTIGFIYNHNMSELLEIDNNSIRGSWNRRGVLVINKETAREMKDITLIAGALV